MVRKFSDNWNLYYPSIRTILNDRVIGNLQILKGQIARQFEQRISGIMSYADRMKVKNPSSILTDIGRLEDFLQQISDERKLEIENMNVSRLKENSDSLITEFEALLRADPQNFNHHFEMLQLTIRTLRNTLDFLEGKVKGRIRMHDEIFGLINEIIKKLDDFKEYNSYQVLRKYLLRVYTILLQANTELKDAEKGFSKGKRIIDKQADRRVGYIKAYAETFEYEKLKESIAITLKYLREIVRIYF